MIKLIGFTGTREGMTNAQKDSLEFLLRMPGELLEFHHGDCVGADQQAHNIARELHAYIIIHPPTDAKLRACCSIAPNEGKVLRYASYLQRNKDIVDSVQLTIAAPRTREPQLKGGTWYTIRYAYTKHRPVVVLDPDGQIICNVASLMWELASLRSASTRR